jgi:hypothetical protein
LHNAPRFPDVELHYRPRFTSIIAA